MCVKQGLNNYHFGRKRHFRRTMWNKAIELTHKKPKDIIAIYLAGPDDYDRDIAIQKGIKNYNLIAIDVNESCINKIKKKQNLAINIDICDFLVNYHGMPKIDIIFADFCCGLVPKTKTFQLATMYSTGLSADVIIVVNLMRGRDAGTQVIKNTLIDFGYDQNMSRHRGLMFYATFIMEYFIYVINKCAIKNEYYTKEECDLFTKIHEYAQPWMHSYRSINEKTIMDSICFRIKSNMNNLKPLSKYHYRRIAALKAWRTMRMQGK